MPISAFNNVPRQYVRITTVDPRHRIIHGVLKDGTSVPVGIISTQALFRWPREGEVWSVQYNNGWYLDEFVELHDPLSAIEDLLPGEARIDADRVVINGPIRVNMVELIPQTDIPSGSGIYQFADGALYYKSPDGTITQIGPP